MYKLTSEDCAAIQRLFDDREAYFATLGLRYHVDVDLERWAAHMRAAPGILEVAATHDPGRCHLHPGNAFWHYLTDSEDRIVACMAHKVLETDDFIQEILNFRLFFDRGPVTHHYPIELCADGGMPRIAGRVGYGGGLWIHPTLRGGRIAGSLTQLDRALSLRHFRIDWNTNLLADTRRSVAMGRRGYRITNDTPILRGVFPLYSTPERKVERDMRLFYMSAEEIIEQAYCERESPVRAGTGSHMPRARPRLVHSQAGA